MRSWKLAGWWRRRTVVQYTAGAPMRPDERRAALAGHATSGPLVRALMDLIDEECYAALNAASDAQGSDREMHFALGAMPYLAHLKLEIKRAIEEANRAQRADSRA
jgi:hypothetical protein